MVVHGQPSRASRTAPPTMYVCMAAIYGARRYPFSRAQTSRAR